MSQASAVLRDRLLACRLFSVVLWSEGRRSDPGGRDDLRPDFTS